jgi:two-component system, response regulator, stage 0 sporulation protein F
MKKKILLVLKDIPLLRLYREEMEDDGYDVQITQSGIEALEIIEKSEIDLILSDAFLENGNILELIKKSREKTPGPKVIATSAYFSQEVDDKDSRILREADLFWYKSSDIESLHAAIRQVLEKTPSQ